jgi:hypothetical protein
MFARFPFQAHTHTHTLESFHNRSREEEGSAAELRCVSLHKTTLCMLTEEKTTACAVSMDTAVLPLCAGHHSAVQCRSSMLDTPSERILDCMAAPIFVCLRLDMTQVSHRAHYLQIIHQTPCIQSCIADHKHASTDKSRRLRLRNHTAHTTVTDSCCLGVDMCPQTSSTFPLHPVGNATQCVLYANHYEDRLLRGDINWSNAAGMVTRPLCMIVSYILQLH